MKRALIIFTSMLLGINDAAAQTQTQSPPIFDDEAMREARDRLYASHGASIISMIALDRLEYRSNEGNPASVWEATAWIGGDINRIWLETEGEHLSSQGETEKFELQALYGRAIHPFWDVRVGVRHNVETNPSRTYLTAGLQGLAPYWFEVDGALFVSNKGDVSATLEAEYELRLTQRLMLQPSMELSAALTDDEESGVGSGLSAAEFGVRLRYEIRRQFAPYIGVTWARHFGDTADLQSDHEDTTTSFVAGIRMWF